MSDGTLDAAGSAGVSSKTLGLQVNYLDVWEEFCCISW